MRRDLTPILLVAAWWMSSGALDVTATASSTVTLRGSVGSVAPSLMSTPPAPASMRPGHTVVRPQLRTGRTATPQAAEIIARETGFARAADGTRIYFEKLGRGPAIALIHGLGGNHAVWYPVVPTLARDHTVIVLAQRGFAPSDGARDRFDVNVLAADFMAVLDATGVNRAVVVGQSMGGWTALAAAVAHPERVSAVVLADSIGGIFDDEIRAHYATTLERARQLGSKPPPLGVHPALAPSFSRTHPQEAYLYQLLTTFGAPSPGVIAQQLGNAEMAHAALENLSFPVLFIVGDDDGIFPPPIVRRASSYVPGARVVEIPGAGHSGYFERPEEWQAALLEFTRATEHRAGSTQH